MIGCVQIRPGLHKLMSYRGIVENGMVKLPPEAHLPDGAEVEIALRVLQPEEDPFLEAALLAAKPRPHWPRDYVLNHGTYVDGEPLK